MEFTGYNAKYPMLVKLAVFNSTISRTHKKHKNQQSSSAYAMHILNNQHEYSNTEHTYNYRNHVKKENLWMAGNLYTYRHCSNNIYWSTNGETITQTPCILWLTRHTTTHHTVPQQLSRHRAGTAITTTRWVQRIYIYIYTIYIYNKSLTCTVKY